MINMGYEWLMFRVGDVVAMLHLTELENSDYVITVDPDNAAQPVVITCNGEALDELPGYVVVTETAAAAQISY